MEGSQTSVKKFRRCHPFFGFSPIFFAACGLTISWADLVISAFGVDLRRNGFGTAGDCKRQVSGGKTFVRETACGCDFSSACAEMAKATRADARTTTRSPHCARFLPPKIWSWPSNGRTRWRLTNPSCGARVAAPIKPAAERITELTKEHPRPEREFKPRARADSPEAKALLGLKWGSFQFQAVTPFPITFRLLGLILPT